MMGNKCFLIYFFLIAEIINIAKTSDANPFYVDPSSIKKEGVKWSMKLINRHASQSKDTVDREIKVADLTIEGVDVNVLNLKIVESGENRWEAPIEFPDSGKQYKRENIENMGFQFENDPFGFNIVDPDTDETIVDMSSSKASSLQFFDKYLEIGLWYPGRRIYGLGERTTLDFQLCTEHENCTYTLWGKDIPCPYDDGVGGGKGAYGQHPFYMIYLPNSKLFSGVFLLNSNDQDALIYKVQGEALRVVHKIIGGVFNFYFFYPKKADIIMKKYHELIGRPYIAPFWSLGYHQCRCGWYTLDVVKEVVAKLEEKDIPLEVVWGDIDYMFEFGDFTVDPVRYKGLGAFVNDLHKKKIRYVPIIDAGLRYNKTYKYYNMGEENSAFIKSAFTKKTLVGKVWPGAVVFLSWYSPYSTSLWYEGLSDLYKLVEFDGIWLDMNEISSLCRGECPPDFIAETENKRMLRMLDDGKDPHDPKEFDDLMYKPGKDPTDATISLTGYENSTNDFEDKVRKQYNTHSLWSLYEAKVTHQFFTEKLKRRPFILTRANFPGSGLFASKWLGDNHSTWEYLRYSIVGMYNFQMFGIPLVGSDMCGFIDNTNEELCLRWMQLGSFYPFSRNHNGASQPQEPYVWDSVALAARNALRQKYSILWYYYTKLYEVSLLGGALVRPLFWEYPEDENTFSEDKNSFLIGPSILIAPVLHPNKKTKTVYLPNQNWYKLQDFTKVLSYEPKKVIGANITLPADFDYVNVLLRGGSIIPYQDALKAKVKRTEQLKAIPIELVVAPDNMGQAYGTFIIDEGDSLKPIENQRYRYLAFNFGMSFQELFVTLIHDYDAPLLPCEVFSKVTILNADKYEKVTQGCILGRSKQKIPITASYDSSRKIITFGGATKNIYWKEIEHINFDRSCNQ